MLRNGRAFTTGLNAALSLATAVMLWFASQLVGDRLRVSTDLEALRESDVQSRQERTDLGRRVMNLEEKHETNSTRIARLEAKIPDDFPPKEWQERVQAIEKWMTVWEIEHPSWKPRR